MNTALFKIVSLHHRAPRVGDPQCMFEVHYQGYGRDEAPAQGGELRFGMREDGGSTIMAHAVAVGDGRTIAMVVTIGRPTWDHARSKYVLEPIPIQVNDELRVRSSDVPDDYAREALFMTIE